MTIEYKKVKTRAQKNWPARLDVWWGSRHLGNLELIITFAPSRCARSYDRARMWISHFMIRQLGGYVDRTNGWPRSHYVWLSRFLNLVKRFHSRDHDPRMFRITCTSKLNGFLPLITLRRSAESEYFSSFESDLNNQMSKLWINLCKNSNLHKDSRCTCGNYRVVIGS